MRRIIFSCLLLLVLSTIAIANDPADDSSMEGLLSREKYYKCDDFQYNATLLIPGLYEAGEIDSIYMILDFIEEECNKKFNWTSTRMLLDMERGSFTEDVYDSTILDDLIGFRYFFEKAKEDPDRYEDGFFYREAGIADRKYRIFLQALAEKVYDTYQPGTLEHLWAGFLKGDFHYFYREIKEPRYDGSDIQRYYLEVMNKITRQHRGQGTNYAGSIGMWIPHGSNELLGNKTQFGFFWGYKIGIVQLDMSLAISAAKTKSIYTYYDDGLEFTTNDLLHVYCGLDIGYELLTTGNNQFELLGGIGYDGLSGDKENTYGEVDDAHFINSLNVNLGFRYKLFVSKYHDWYVGVQTRYNVIDFDSEGGSDLSGNAVTLEFIVGRLSSGEYKRQAKDLGFYD
ncbi:MAG: hypothetical protein R3F48_11990 [Candidatus Zixiibacteriota bacterium]